LILSFEAATGGQQGGHRKATGGPLEGEPQEGRAQREHRNATGGPREGHRRAIDRKAGPQGGKNRRATGGPQEGHKRATGGGQRASDERKRERGRHSDKE
jgi:hypothetical protein